MSVAVRADRKANQTRQRLDRALRVPPSQAADPSRTKRASAPPVTPAASRGGFGPVATIDTAPVSIGNSVSGSKPIIIPTKDGVRVKGRDFMFSVYPVAAGTTAWTLAGGCPIVPHALVSSNIKNYAGMYSTFRIHGVAFHFITACSTGTPGDVMFYVAKSRGDPCLNSSSANFMSAVLSDHNTVMGPLWKNHSAVYYPTQDTYSTDILNDEDLTHQGPGEVFLFTKSSSLQTPGYVIMDYDVTFSVMQVNVRALTFPISRMKFTQVGFQISSLATTISVTRVIGTLTGNLLDGVTAGVAPSGITVGDIFKVIMCVSAGSITGITAPTFLQYPVKVSDGTLTGTALPIVDGFTSYGVYYATNAIMLYPTFEEAAAQSNPYLYGASGTVTYSIPAYISLVGTVGGLTQSNI